MFSTVFVVSCILHTGNLAGIFAPVRHNLLHVAMHQSHRVFYHILFFPYYAVIKSSSIAIVKLQNHRKTANVKHYKIQKHHETD